MVFLPLYICYHCFLQSHRNRGPKELGARWGSLRRQQYYAQIYISETEGRSATQCLEESFLILSPSSELLWVSDHNFYSSFYEGCSESNASCFMMLAQADAGGMAVEVEPSHKHPIIFCCCMTAGSRGAVQQNGI